MLIKRIESLCHIDEIMICLSDVVDSINQKDIFIHPSKDYIERIIKGFGVLFGAYIDDKLVGFASVIFPKNNHNNLGKWINLKDTELNRVVQLEHIAVLPKYQNSGVGSALFTTIIQTYQKSHQYLVSTISPKNISSLSLAFKFDQYIKKHCVIYGVERFIMCRCFDKKYTIKTFEALKVNNINKMCCLLDKNYTGISFTSDKESIIYAWGYYEKI